MESADNSEKRIKRLLERGGFPEPCLADEPQWAERWRAQTLTDLVREDVVEFSRLHEIGAMRLFVDMLRERVGSPLSSASLAGDLAVSPTTLRRYLDILQALFIVFTVQPWHRNIARSLLQAPKVYFFDTGLVRGDEGARFENAVATMLLKHVQFNIDARGRSYGLHYLRTKDGAGTGHVPGEGRPLGSRFDLVCHERGDEIGTMHAAHHDNRWQEVR